MNILDKLCPQHHTQLAWQIDVYGVKAWGLPSWLQKLYRYPKLLKAYGKMRGLSLDRHGGSGWLEYHYKVKDIHTGTLRCELVKDIKYGGYLIKYTYTPINSDKITNR